MRAGEEWRLAVGRHDLVEHQHQRGGDEADPDRAERGAAEPVGDAGLAYRVAQREAADAFGA